MKFYSYFSVFVLSLLLAIPSKAETGTTILPRIAKSIGVSATRNVENSEKLFCYIVSNKPSDYNGYTINDMAVTGFCGIIDDNLKNMLFEQLFATPENIDFDYSENCTIQPRVLLRFVRGVDNTDVLLSAPCYSMTVFYGGKLETYNMKSATHLLDTVTNAFQTSQTKFVSPALINQLLPIGVPQTAEQRATLAQPSAAKRSWATKETAESSSQGWNSLNFRK